MSDDDIRSPGVGDWPAASKSEASTGDTDWTRGWQVWVVLGALFLAFLVAPWGLILLRPVQDSVRIVGFSFRDAYLIVPLLPAIGLGGLGVWTALRSRGPD